MRLPHGTAFEAFVASLCIVVGVLHPLQNDRTKDALLTICTAKPGGVNCSAGDARHGVIPFHPLTLTLMGEVLSIASTSAVAVYVLGWQAGCVQLLDLRELRKLWLMGFLYGLGDFCQTIASSHAMGTVIVIISQSKLLITAALAWALLGKREEQWGRLWIIAGAVAAYSVLTSQSKATEMERTGQLYGALLALFKNFLSALAAVFAQKFFSHNTEASFWILTTRIQVMMLAASVVVLLPSQIANGSLPVTASGMFLSGRDPICDFSHEQWPDGWCDPMESGVAGICRCMDRSGWDAQTLMAVILLVLNGVATGLTLRYLSAVGKSICNACGIAFFYIAHAMVGLSKQDHKQSILVIIIIYHSFHYSQHKSRARMAE